MNEMGKAETRISERWLHNFNLVREGKVERKVRKVQYLWVGVARAIDF